MTGWIQKEKAFVAGGRCRMVLISRCQIRDVVMIEATDQITISKTFCKPATRSLEAGGTRRSQTGREKSLRLYSILECVAWVMMSGMCFYDMCVEDAKRKRWWLLLLFREGTYPQWWQLKLLIMCHTYHLREGRNSVRSHGLWPTRILEETITGKNFSSVICIYMMNEMNG